MASTIQRSPWPFPTPVAQASAVPGVRERRLRQPRGSSSTEIEFRGAELEAVQKAAQRRVDSIDAYRSPAVQSTRRDGAEWVCTVRFYNVD